VAEAAGETWARIDELLKEGGRGLPGGSSLQRLLTRKGGVRHPSEPPKLTVESILAWADAHYARTRIWPGASSGPVVDAPGETWRAVHAALVGGRRGLPGGTTLPRFLAEHRGKRPGQYRPCLTEQEIRAWAEAYRQRTGRRPTHSSGAIPESPGDTWLGVDQALRDGRRGLTAGSSLARLLAGAEPGDAQIEA
jgi:hypothetical protein